MGAGLNCSEPSRDLPGPELDLVSYFCGGFFTCTGHQKPNICLSTSRIIYYLILLITDIVELFIFDSLFIFLESFRMTYSISFVSLLDFNIIFSTLFWMHFGMLKAVLESRSGQRLRMSPSFRRC